MGNEKQNKYRTRCIKYFLQALDYEVFMFVFVKP